ncbi:MAG: FHA domain-containing protein [Acidimicrobiia bacterium]|nr:FHA domain-containing protein [Acidimicrobiia bacterium]
MQIGFDDGSTHHELDVVVHDPDATVADLAAALGVDGDLFVDGRRCPAERRLDRAGIAQGSTVATGAPAAGAPVEAGGPAALTVRVAGGLDAGASVAIDRGHFVIGRAGGLLDLRDTTVSAHHAVLELDGDGGLTVDDIGSHNGTWLGDTLVAGPTALEPGRVLRLGASQLVTAPAVDDRPVGRRGRMTAAGTVPFNRPPRPSPPVAGDPIEPPAAPDVRPAPHPIGVVGVVAPLAMGLVMVLVFRSLVFGLFALLSPVLLVGNAIETRRREHRGSRRDRARYERELATFRSQLRARAVEERLRRTDELPDPAEVARRALGPSTRLWERRLHHHDALHLRAGLGAVAWEPPVAGDRRAWSPEVRAAVAEASRIDDAPALVDVSAGGVVGLVGDREAALAVARSLVVQAATHHGPADLAVAVLAAPERADRWDWAKWLPHTLDAGGSGQRLLTADGDAAERLLRGLLERQVATAAHPSSVTGTVTLVVIDDPSLTEGRRSPARSLLRSDAVAGLVIAPTEDRLPAVCRTVVELRDGDGTARIHRVDHGERLDDVLAAGVTDDTARLVARALARHDDPELDVAGAGLPGTVGLLPLLALDPPTADELLARWVAAGDDPDLLAPLGVSEDGVLEVDLVRDGPHGLVAGTTGAGKSELLRTLVAGLAAGCSPDHLTFVLVDFKGGSAFDRCAGLPHTVGLVTDLDASLAARALRCLEAELRFRERALREAGAADLTEHRRRAPGQPIPRLVVVVDEFATLRAELPNFVDSLVGVAQRGRSLGVHLVLATQRPSGAISDNIRANTNLRIALRVQDASDSEDVIDRPDAARIGRNQPGRALVRLGPGEVVAVQTALSTGVATALGHGPVEVRPFRFGPQPPAVEAAAGSGTESDLQRLVDAAVEAHRRSGRPFPRRPWPDPLPSEVDLDALDALAGATGPAVPFALADDPDAQTQYPVGWDPAGGNLLLAGIPGSGTTTACASVVLALAARASADDLHIHALDLGAGDLAPLAGLPHVGSVVTAAEPERQLRLVRWLRAELDRRRAGTDGAESPRVVLVLDGLAAFRAQWDDSLSGVMEDLQRVFADGPDHGLHTVVAADRLGAVPAWLQSLVRQRWLFRTGDPIELSSVGLRTSDVPALGPGGAVLADGGLVVQVARPADGVTAAVARLAARHANEVARPPVAIGVLPTEVDPQLIAAAARLDDDRWVLPVGISSATLGVAALTLHPGEHALVAGPSRSGRSTTLATIAGVARSAQPDVHIVAVTAGRSPLETSPDVDAVLRADDPRISELAAASGPVLVLVDDADLVDDTAGALTALLTLRRAGLHVVAAGRNEALRAAYGHWTRPVRASRAAVLLQPDLDLDGDLAGTMLPRRSIVALTRGRGYVVCGGERDIVQIAALHESD